MIHLLDFQWHDLINPEFYIQIGGLWLLLFIIFAETGLFAGFFLPGDSLLFVAGIYSRDLASQLIPASNEYIDLLLLWIIITTAGVLGNYVGYWFGLKSGNFLYERKDSFFFKKNIFFVPQNFIIAMEDGQLLQHVLFRSSEPLHLLLLVW